MLRRTRCSYSLAPHTAAVDLALEHSRTLQYCRSDTHQHKIKPCSNTPRAQRAKLRTQTERLHTGACACVPGMWIHEGNTPAAPGTALSVEHRQDKRRISPHGGQVACKRWRAPPPPTHSARRWSSRMMSRNTWCQRPRSQRTRLSKQHAWRVWATYSCARRDVQIRPSSPPSGCTRFSICQQDGDAGARAHEVACSSRWACMSPCEQRFARGMFMPSAR